MMLRLLTRSFRIDKPFLSRYSAFCIAKNPHASYSHSTSNNKHNRSELSSDNTKNKSRVISLKGIKQALIKNIDKKSNDNYDVNNEKKGQNTKINAIKPNAISAKEVKKAAEATNVDLELKDLEIIQEKQISAQLLRCTSEDQIYKVYKEKSLSIRPIHLSIMFFKLINLRRLENRLELMLKTTRDKTNNKTESKKETNKKGETSQSIWKDEKFLQIYQRVYNEIENMNPESLCKVMSGLVLVKNTNAYGLKLVKKIVSWLLDGDNIILFDKTQVMKFWLPFSRICHQPLYHSEKDINELKSKIAKSIKGEIVSEKTDSIIKSFKCLSRLKHRDVQLMDRLNKEIIKRKKYINVNELVKIILMNHHLKFNKRMEYISQLIDYIITNKNLNTLKIGIMVDLLKYLSIEKAKFHTQRIDCKTELTTILISKIIDRYLSMNQIQPQEQQQQLQTQLINELDIEEKVKNQEGINEIGKKYRMDYIKLDIDKKFINTLIRLNQYGDNVLKFMITYYEKSIQMNLKTIINIMKYFIYYEKYLKTNTTDNINTSIMKEYQSKKGKIFNEVIKYFDEKLHKLDEYNICTLLEIIQWLKSNQMLNDTQLLNIYRKAMICLISDAANISRYSLMKIYQHIENLINLESSPSPSSLSSALSQESRTLEQSSRELLAIGNEHGGNIDYLNVLCTLIERKIFKKYIMPVQSASMPNHIEDQSQDHQDINNEEYLLRFESSKDIKCVISLAWLITHFITKSYPIIENSTFMNNMAHFLEKNIENIGNINELIYERLAELYVIYKYSLKNNAFKTIFKKPEIHNKILQFKKFNQDTNYDQSSLNDQSPIQDQSTESIHHDQDLKNSLYSKDTQDHNEIILTEIESFFKDILKDKFIHDKTDMNTNIDNVLDFHMLQFTTSTSTNTSINTGISTSTSMNKKQTQKFALFLSDNLNIESHIQENHNFFALRDKALLYLGYKSIYIPILEWIDMDKQAKIQYLKGNLPT